MIETESAAQKGVHEDQYLTFVLGDEEYAIDILRVQEIRGWEPVSRVPNVPSYEKGVINLRGAIVPIFDLRERFEVGENTYKPTTVVVVVNTLQDSGTKTMGIVVDAVADVIHLPPEAIQPAPDFGGRISTEFVKGVSSMNDRLLVLLDVDRLLRLEERYAA